MKYRRPTALRIVARNHWPFQLTSMRSPTRYVRPMGRDGSLTGRDGGAVAAILVEPGGRLPGETTPGVGGRVAARSATRSATRSARRSPGVGDVPNVGRV